MRESQLTTLTRGEMRRIFKRYRGAASKLAEDIGCHKVTISQGLRGFQVSERIMSAIRLRATELLAAEQQREKGAA